MVGFLVDRAMVFSDGLDVRLSERRVKEASMVFGLSIWKDALAIYWDGEEDWEDGTHSGVQLKSF